MANAIIAINFANTTDLRDGTSTITSINPAGLKTALQSGNNLYDVSLKNATFNGNTSVVGAVSGLNLAIGNGSILGSTGTITSTSNISAGGNIVFNGVSSNIVGTNSIGSRTISTTVPTVCGTSGDIWYTV